MRFARVHKAASYLLVLTSTLALAASGELPPPLVALTLGGMALSWFWEPPRVELRRYDKLWNLLTILILLGAGFDVFTGGPLLQTGTWFVLFLVVNKLFNRKTSRDYLQVYVLSLLEMIAATALDSDLTYGVFFLLYIVFATWTLILFHLKREMEENFLLKYEEGLNARPVQVERVLNSRRLVGARFLAATSLVSLAVFLGSALVFFAFPRVGFGLFFQGRRAGVTMSGFSDRVELGHHGTIKDDPTVVMRVEFPEGNRDRVAHYWRGIALDHYDGRTWTKSDPKLNMRRIGRDGFVELARARPGEALVTQSIYLEPMESRVLFGLSRITSISLRAEDDVLARRRGLLVDGDGDLHAEDADQIAFRYTIRSQAPSVPAEARATPLEAYRDAMRDKRVKRYLQLPEGLDPRVAELGREIVGDAATVGEAIERVERYLHTELSYTLDLGRDARYAPLEDFLFVQKRGHCEYFSTALVILLRTQGIAARNVNGFLGGTWNDYGQYLAVSQGDAHSWVEALLWAAPAPEGVTETAPMWWETVLGRAPPPKPRSRAWTREAPLPGGVWSTREPTPAGAGRASTAGMWTAVAQFVDALRLRWYKYVIEYDLQSQLAGFGRVGAAWRSMFGESGESFGESQRPQAGGARWSPGAGVLLVPLGLILAAWAWRRRRRPAPATTAHAPGADLYRTLLQVYTRLGHPRAPSATAREYLATLRAGDAPGLSLATRVVALYEAARFGGTPTPPAEVRHLQRELRHLRRPAR